MYRLCFALAAYNALAIVALLAVAMLFVPTHEPPVMYAPSSDCPVWVGAGRFTEDMRPLPINFRPFSALFVFGVHGFLSLGISLRKLSFTKAIVSCFVTLVNV